MWLNPVALKQNDGTAFPFLGHELGRRSAKRGGQGKKHRRQAGGQGAGTDTTDTTFSIFVYLKAFV